MIRVQPIFHPEAGAIMQKMTRRDVVKASVAAAAGATAAETMLGGLTNVSAAVRATPRGQAPVKIKFSVCGTNHNHIQGMTDAVIRGGGQLVSFYEAEPALAKTFATRYPQARQAASEKEILDDATTKLVLSSIIPIHRAPLGVRVMKAGKDYMSDKPGIITLEQLAEVRKVQAETKRIYSICYSERFENRATVKAGELVKAGAIGRVIQTIGMGPHRINPPDRPEWFWDPKQYGGIICDIGAHQFDQFLYFTNSTSGTIVSSQVGNVNHPDRPAFQDFGDVMVRGNKGTGYIRLDWFTPAGLPVWGDGRLTILGTEGYIEARKYVDIGGKTGADHLFLVDKKGVQYIDAKDVVLPYGPALVDDILNRTETAMPQVHAFLATELALKAQAQAQVMKI
jgi:predicted dehydrogenase